LNLSAEARRPAVATAAAARPAMIPDLARPESKIIVVACHGMTIGSGQNIRKRSARCIGSERRKSSFAAESNLCDGGPSVETKRQIDSRATRVRQRDDLNFSKNNVQTNT
jgi:hypothetical protein